jgi:hypothetical protein
VPHEYTTASGTFRLEQASTPVDDHRGGLSAEIVDDRGVRIAALQIYCHPDFPGYDACCLLTSSEMLAQAAERLQLYGHEGILLGESCGGSVGLFLNPPAGAAV